MNTHPSNRWPRRLLVGTDLLGSILAFFLAYWLRLKVFEPEQIFSPLVLAFACINFLTLYVFDLYSLDPQLPLWKKPLQTIIAAAAGGTAIVLLAYLSGAIEFTGIIGRGVLIGAQVLFALWAAYHRFWMSKRMRRVNARTRWLVLGNDEALRPFVRDLYVSNFGGYFAILTPEGGEVVVEKKPDVPVNEAVTIQQLGSWKDLQKVASESWSAIVVAAGNALPEDMVEILLEMRLRGTHVMDLADFYELIWYKVPVYYLQRSWFAMSQGFALLHNPIGLKLKRVGDILGASLLLLLASPFMILAAIAIKLESRGPILFSQVRVGENGEPFTVFKLRSMRTDAEKHGAQWAAKNDSRVTRVGAFIRATRIDELPQLFNVLRGEMSFIGPRPERPEFTGMLEKEIPFYSLRHILRPGVTGWAQVMYPYGASVEDAREKLQFELYYIKNYSLLLDAAIVLKTVRVVLFGQGR